MSERVVLVTGASSGIGMWVAARAAEAGHRVVAGMRDPDRAGLLHAAVGQLGAELDVRQLDVTDDDSVTGCVAEVAARYGRLDVLVSTSGSGHVGAVETDRMADVRAAMEINYFGLVRMVRAVLPHLRTAASGQLIAVTGIGGVLGQPFHDACCAAAFAVEGLLESLAPVAATFGVGVSVVEPGPVIAETGPGPDPGPLLAAAGPYAPALRAWSRQALERMTSGSQAADEVAAVVLDVIGHHRPPFRVQTSPAATGLVGIKLADADGAAVQRLTASMLV